MKCVIFVVILCLATYSNADKKFKNKYSAEANRAPPTEPPPAVPMEKYDPDFRNLQKPFRMAKLNMVWAKATHRITEPKLKSLFTELKIHDKEELAWKKLNSEHKDKDGLKAAELRKKLIGIMSSYDLLEHFDDTQDAEKVKEFAAYSGKVDNYKNKSLFKDKKLNRLWEKAEVAGFTPEELKTLKEEFMHHQEKVDVYHSVLDSVTSGKQDHHMNAINEDELAIFNEVGAPETMNEDPSAQKHQEYYNDANLLREKHRDLRDNYDRLERIAAKGPNSQDFVEPKVQGLWRAAAASNFTVDELASLRIELLHYESRLLKLRHMHAEHALGSEKHKHTGHGDKHDKLAGLAENIKKQSRKVEKLHEHIQSKIYKHTEL